MSGVIRYFGRAGIGVIEYAGGSMMLLARTFFWIAKPPFRSRQIAEQMVKIGINSFPISTLTNFFIGVVITFQSAYQMQKVNAEMYIPSLVAISMTREIGPMLTALVVAGRVGASMAAEIGSMKVTEQLDALETLATNPVKYLVTPRFIALFTMLPILTVFSDFVGILGGYLVCVHKLGLSHELYLRMTFEPLMLKDIFTGLFKTLIFATIICNVACYEGMRVEGGAEGVGRATTRAVVMSFILIILADAFFTIMFYFVT
jgi:phospholipid/cholesterol/gamma-HCH transport system permease protein